MPPEVDEAAIFELLDERAGADVGKQTRQRRTPPAGIDHEIGAHLVAVLGDHPDNVWNTADLVVAREQTLHSDAAAHLDARRTRRDPPDRGLDHWAASRQHCETCVFVAHTAAHRHRHPVEWVQPERAIRVELGRDRGQLHLHDLAKAREEVVQHPELVHTPALPGIPRLRRRRRGRRRIALEHAHPVSVAGEQHRRGLTGESASDDHDLDHAPWLPSHAVSDP